MTKAAIKGLLGRRLRTALTAMAIILGVAMVSGTFVLTDTMTKAFDKIFAGSYANTSAVITGKEVVKEASSGNSTVPASLLPEVQGVDGVESASGAIFNVSGTTDLVDLIGRDGKQLGSSQQPHFGWGFDPSQTRFNPMTLNSGKWATGPDQIVIDAGTAKNENYKLGDTIGVAGEGPQRQMKVVGIAKFGDVDSIGGATFGVFDVPTAQELLNKKDQFDAIFVAAKQGASDAEVADRIRPLLPSTAQVQTGTEQGEADAESTNEGLSIFKTLLLAFAGIALVVGSFVIFNTLSMTVAQRVRELATLRTLGASRKQVKRSVLLEGLVIGLFASIVGLFLGVGVALGLKALFVAFGINLPSQGIVFQTRTVIVSLLVGVGVTLLASISPARHAARVAPIAAVREGATIPRSRIAEHPTTAVTVTALAAAAIVLGLFAGLDTGPTLMLIGVGCILLFVAVGLVANRAVRPLAAALGYPGERIGGTPGRLARENATRNPARTARTAGALMIGLALVTLVATLGAGLKSTDRNALEQQVLANYVVTSENGYEPFTGSANTALSRNPNVALATGVRYDQANAIGDDIDVTGVDPSTIGRVYDFRWQDKSSAALLSLGFDGAIVRHSFAEDHDLKVGGTFSLTTPQGKKVPLTVRGIYKPPAEDLDPLLGEVTLAQRAFDTHFPRPKDLFGFVETRTGTSDETTASLEKTLAAYPDTVIRTKAGWVDKRAAGIDQILNIFYVLLALSIVVSLFGMVNALALAVFERTRELGMLRAIGLTRRQTRRMVRYESVITALIGAALGLPLGLALGAVLIRAMSDLDVVYAVPIVPILVFTVVAILAGMLAAMLPARRASRLNVLNALQYE